MISVIIPVFNAEKFIYDAYQEIIDQNLVDFEIIFVDNNSIDQSVELIKNIQIKDARIKFFREERQGAASARNKGLKEANGEFIYFFDVDDQIFEGALNELYSTLKENQTLDSVFGKIYKSNLRKDSLVINVEDISSYEVKIYEKPYWGLKWLDYSLLPNPSAFLHRKSVIKKIGNFNPDLLLGEDAAFHVKLGMKCRLGFLDKNITLYYRHENSTVSKENALQKEKVFTYWQPLIKEHLPYYFNNETPFEYYKIVLTKAYASIGKILSITDSLKRRFLLRKKLINEIKPLKTPFLLELFIVLIMITGSQLIYKFYFHYVLKLYVNSLSVQNKLA